MVTISEACMHMTCVPFKRRCYQYMLVRSVDSVRNDSLTSQQLQVEVNEGQELGVDRDESPDHQNSPGLLQKKCARDVNIQPDV